MKRANLFKTGAGLVALALASCTTGNKLEQKPVEQPKTAQNFSKLPVETQVEYFFKIPVRQNEQGDFTGFRSTESGVYTVVYCSRIGDLDSAINFNMFYAKDELARQLNIRKGIIENTRVNRTRRVGDFFCGSYSVDRKDVRRK